MDTNTVHSWPLPVGHRYGPQGFDLRNHDGRAPMEQVGLRAWQNAYQHRIKRVSFPGGYWDSVTQSAAVEVQRLAGLPVTGLIDADTWAAVWTVEKPKIEPKPVQPPSRRAQRLKHQLTRDYWRRISATATFTGDGSQPRWWPGRPFGPGEHGWHVEVLQDLIQARKTGVYGRETAARVRALRRVHQLPVSDVVDLPLAVALDPGPWG